MIARIFRLFRALDTAVFFQFIRYACVGAFNTVVDFGVYLALTRATDMFEGRYVVASSLSFLVAVAVSYVLNALWTFRHSIDDWQRRAPRFLMVALGGLAISTGTLWLCLALGTHDIIAKMAASFASAAWNFPMHRFWTFRK